MTTNARTTSNPRPAKSSGASKTDGIKDNLESIEDNLDSIGEKVQSNASTIAKAGVAVVAGTAVAALAGAAFLHSRTRQKHVLGISMPSKKLDLSSVAKQIGDMAGRVEKASAELSDASGRAKKATEALI